MNPGVVEDVIFFLLVTFIISIPVAGVTARIALRPVVDALLRLREGFAARDLPADSRLEAMGAEIEMLRATVLLLARNTQPASAPADGPPSAAAGRVLAAPSIPDA